MAYAIMRINKCKLGAVSRIEKHHERKKDVYKSNPDIDVSKTHKNFHIKDPPDSYRRLIRKRIEEVGCRTRKDSVVLQDSICTASPEFFKGKTSRETEDFFRTAYRFYCKTFGADNIISAVVHLDERTPHMHVCFVPITKDGKLSSKTVIGGPAGLVKLQDDFYSHMFYQFSELKRGIPKRITHRKHLPTYLFKNADMLMEHFDEISKAINDINMLKSKEKKAQAIELISRYAPEMAKMKEQLKSVNGYVEKLNKDIWDEREISRHWIGKTEQLEKEVKGKNIEIKLLQAKQQELQKEIDRIPPGLLKQLDAMERARRKELNRNDHIR